MKIREIKQHNSFSIGIILFLFFFDLLSFYTSYYMVATILEAGSIINYPLIIVFGIIILFYLFGRYNPSSLQSRSAEFKIIVSLTSLSTFVYLIYKISFQIITIKQSQYIVFLVFLFLIIVTISRLFIRTAQKQLLKWNVGLRNSIIIGSGDIGCKFLKKINNKEYLGYKIIGYFEFSDTIPKSIKENIFNLDEVYIGFLSEVNEFVSNNNIKEVIIALNTNNNDKLLQIIADLKSCNVCIKIVPNIYDILKGYAKMHSVTGMPLIDVNPNILTEFQIVLKRLIDIIVSIIGLSIMLIPFLIIALLIKISSPGKIIFKQRRIGLNGVEFIVHKFRTMHSNSEQKTGPIWASKDDPRITSIGKILRKTRMDEFPQLYDVLIGNMSIVGPRPERKFFVDKLKVKFPYYSRRLNVRPGITGWAQIMGDYDTSIDNVESKLKLDFYYIENISIWLDLKIMVITFWIIFKGEGQ